VSMILATEKFFERPMHLTTPHSTTLLAPCLARTIRRMACDVTCVVTRLVHARQRVYAWVISWPMRFAYLQAS
jgi:hypothetical protein